jgi:hypothetical protein
MATPAEIAPRTELSMSQGSKRRAEEGTEDSEERI